MENWLLFSLYFCITVHGFFPPNSILEDTKGNAWLILPSYFGIIPCFDAVWANREYLDNSSKIEFI